MALNLKQRKFIEENQDLFNQILKEIPYEETTQQLQEEDLAGLTWDSLENFIEKLKTIISSDACDISLFSDGDTVGFAWLRTEKVQYTESEREYKAFIKMQNTIRERESEERKRKLQQEMEKSERILYERLKKKFEGQ